MFGISTWEHKEKLKLLFVGAETGTVLLDAPQLTIVLQTFTVSKSL